MAPDNGTLSLQASAGALSSSQALAEQLSVYPPLTLLATAPWCRISLSPSLATIQTAPR